MNVMKKGFSAIAIIFLLALIFSAPPVRADGTSGVRETADAFYVQVPRFCKPRTFKWYGVYKEDGSVTKVALLSSIAHADKDKVDVIHTPSGVLGATTVWRGGEEIRIPKFIKGQRIVAPVISILASGAHTRLKDFDPDNWFVQLSLKPDQVSVPPPPPDKAGSWGTGC